MGWFGKLTLGTLGLLFGGPLGAIAGGALGHLLDKGGESVTRSLHGPRGPSIGTTEQAQAAYFVSLFSILGKLSKIDGVVSREEIGVVKDFIDQLPIDDRERQFARRVFNQAKDSPYSIDDFAMQFFQTTRNQPTLSLSFFDLLFRIAAADGTFHPAEEAALKRIKEIFQISDNQFDNLKSTYFKDTNKYYRVLNCTPESSEQEIRSNYKKLVKDFHPDTIVSKGLPEEFSEFATKRFQEIQDAYEHIMQDRGRSQGRKGGSDV